MKTIRIAAWLAVLTLCLTALLSGIAENEEVAEIMLNNREIRKCYPPTYSAELAVEKGLSDESGYSARYFELQAAYARGLWQLLNDRCDIMGLDAEIASDALRFLPEQTPVSVYQTFWSFGAKYLFLRSNLHIERLSAQDLDELESLGQDTDGLAAFVERSLLDVVRPYPQLPDAVAVQYETGGTFAANGALVLGLATTPEYDGNGHYLSTDHEVEKKAAIQDLIQRTQARMTDQLGVPVVILEY